jgi:hypothetical protein
MERTYPERENHKAVTDSQTLQRIKDEESLAEQQGKQALNNRGNTQRFPTV